MPSTDLRAVLLTGDGLRHRYAARLLTEVMDLAGVVTEHKLPPLPEGQALGSEDLEILRSHLAERDAVERELLGPVPGFPAVPVLAVQRGAVNRDECFAWVQQLAPDVVLLFGTGMVAQPLLCRFEGRVVNLHLGLSPYYRGSATNFWPLVNREPECVGATIHLALPEVDAGGILAQVRPQPQADDGPHHLGTKALLAGLGLVAPAILRYLDGQMPRPQDLSLGRVYRRRDFTATAVLRMRQNMRERMMDEYVLHAATRCATYPIVELGPEPAHPGASA